MHFRVKDGSSALPIAMAELVGCADLDVLAPLHAAFLDGDHYPPDAVDISVRFPPEAEPLPVDLCASRFLPDDADVDRRIRSMMAALRFEDRPCCVLRDAVAAPRLPDTRSLFAGLRARRPSRERLRPSCAVLTRRTR